MEIYFAVSKKLGIEFGSLNSNSPSMMLISIKSTRLLIRWWSSDLGKIICTGSAFIKLTVLHCVDFLCLDCGVIVRNIPVEDDVDTRGLGVMAVAMFVTGRGQSLGSQ